MLRPALVCALLLSCKPAPTSTFPPCGSNEAGPATLIPGPGHEGFDAALASEALKHDRQFHGLNALATGVTADVSLADADAKAAVEQFIATDEWDFKVATGREPATLGRWSKSAGLYAGVGVAADAFRYGVLRDTGAACADVDRAKSQLLRGLEALDTAARIPGVEGVMARSLLNGEFSDVPTLTPLFDDAGAPLPLVKDNGSWRADNSGAYPALVWEDSISRDMLLGWAMAFGASFEVLDGDPSLTDDLKQRLRDDARNTARSLMRVGTHGYDLEILDADGRVTLNGYLNENAIDQLYAEGANNGPYALMSLGIVGALARAADDDGIDTYLADQLLAERRLDRLALTYGHLYDFGPGTNFSGSNMVFTGAFLAQRYVPGDAVQARLRQTTRDELYDHAGSTRQPVEMKQSFFDLIDADATRPSDVTAIARATETLNDFAHAPTFDLPRTNCDADEIAAKQCTLDDGTQVTLLGEVGWNGQLIAEQPVPMRVRPSSNYFWRSNPYAVNGGGETGMTLLSAVDFRVAYWLGRWVKVEP